MRPLALSACSGIPRGNFVHSGADGAPRLTPRPIARYNPATMASDSNVYFDQRTYRRHIKSGRLTEAEYDAHVAGLPDVADNIMDPEEGGDDDGYETRTAAKNDPEAEAAVEEALPADPFAAAPLGAPMPAPAAPIAPPVAVPSINDAPAPPPPPLEVPIGAAPIIPPKVD